ncbi:MAG: TonB-dependent receptor, partial [Verrucomicrobiota bacterium]
MSTSMLSPFKTSTCRFAAAVLLGLGGDLLAQQTAGPASPEDIKPVNRLNAFDHLSLEDLVTIKVTSVSKRETSIHDAAAAITVITQEDIRRSGLTSIPELLRLVPGMNVARIDGDEWAVSARGFNAQWANKLLVLVDGRSVYTPAFSGVFWNTQDLVLDDLERIEVIRGPGATLWGANAVNGVINIITKSAKETQGFLMTTSAGTEDQPAAAIRYGGKLGDGLYYRTYVKYFNREGLVDAAGNPMPDDWDMTRAGMRLDWEPSTDNRYTLQGDYYYGHSYEIVRVTTLTAPFSRTFNANYLNKGGNVLGRWTHDFSDSSQLTLQTYYDGFVNQNGTTTEKRDTFDFDLQHNFELGERHNVVWGLGYRYTKDNLASEIRWTPQSAHDQLYSAFVQDEITLIEDRLKLTLGSKFEYNDYTDFEVQPSGRLLWTPTERQSVWAGVSRAVRTPSRFESGSRLNIFAFQPGPFAPVMLGTLGGNPNIQSEELFAYELGYRINPTDRWTFDIAGFYNVYDGLVDYLAAPAFFEATPPPAHTVIPLVAQNSLSGETYGAELTAQWQATDYLRLTAGYTHLHMRLRPNQSEEAVSPEHQVHLRAYLDLPRNVQLNGAIYYVDHTRPLASNPAVPAYWRLDLGATWRPTKSLEVGIFGQNLLDNHHPEFTSQKATVNSEVPRGVYGKLTWR